MNRNLSSYLPFFGVMLVLLVCFSACGGRKRDAAYYMNMVDSIRKAEQLKRP